MGEGEQQRILKDSSAFSNFSCKTLIIRGITSESQGLLTTIVGKMNSLNPVRLVRKSNFILFFNLKVFQRHHCLNWLKENVFFFYLKITWKHISLDIFKEVKRLK